MIKIWVIGFRVYWGYIGIMENKMETTIVYRGYRGIMEKKVETTTLNPIPLPAAEEDMVVS